jgi:PAS domain S-box-containing protein
VQRSRERLSAGLTSTLGAALTVVTVWDIGRHAVGDDHTLGLLVFESVVPLSAAVVLVAVGLALFRGWGDATFARRSGAWSLAGGALVAWLAGVSFVTHLDASVEDSVVFLGHLAAVGGVGGLVAAYFGAGEERRRVESERERNRLRALFENSRDPIVKARFTDGGPVVADVNPAFERTFGYDADAVCGASVDGLLAPGRTDEAESLSERARQGERVEATVERRTADGDVRTFRLQALPVEEPGRRLPRVGYAVYSDRTDDERFLRQLTGLHNYTRRLMGVTDPEAVLGEAVPAANDLLGFEVVTVFVYDPEAETLRPKVLTETALDLFDGEVPSLPVEGSTAGRVFREDERVVTGDIRGDADAFNPESPLRSEMLFPLGDHGVFVVASTEPDAFDDRGVVLAEILADNVEAALTRATREAEIRQQKERLDEFASVVSHDLRNPLHAARGYLDLAREGGDPEHFDRVDGALDRMESLVDDLLALARGEREMDIEEAVDLDAVVHGAWDHAETASAALDVAGDLGTVTADRKRLDELLGNLFRNAVEHGGEAVTVTVGRTDEGFFVDDDGSGIDPAVRDSLFEEGVTTDDDGTGFGMAIVERIAEAHGWSVSLTESERGGARFEIRTEHVPRTESPAVEADSNER